jgi:uncharacterized membrane protein YeaQ/YmgE (transglycosylase-associated protein family)
VLADVLLVLLSGFVTGALARFAVPGPDPMPAWLTIAIGLAGSAIGGGVAYALFGRNTTVLSIGGFVAAIILVVLYRRFVQKRPITGPEALKFPERGVGVDRYRERMRQLTAPAARVTAHEEEQERAARADEVTNSLRRLAELRDTGVITAEEFETKKAELLARL